MTRLLIVASGLLMSAVCHSAATGATENLILGFHAHDPAHISAASQAGYSAIRLWDSGTDWSGLAPQRNLWNFDRINLYLAASEKVHLKILWTLGGTPRWASARPFEKCSYGLGCAAEPANIEEWRRYVRTIAITFRGRIECYEPWNEVSFPTDPVFTAPGAGGSPDFYTGSVASMVELARVAYEEIKQADPEACVLSPSFHSSGHWVEKFDRFLDAGGGKYFDVASQHFYFGDEPEPSASVIRLIRQSLDKHGLQRIPIWNTEVGIPFPQKASQWSGASLEEVVYALTLRTYLVNLSEGIPRIYWYAWDNGEFGFFDPVTHQDFGSQAAAAAVHVLDGFESGSCSEKGEKGGLWQCHVHAGDHWFKVLWMAGEHVKPREVVLEHDATRWGRKMELFAAGSKFLLDGRPVIVEDGA